MDVKPDKSLTPMASQYEQVRAGLPEGTLLLFRLGDFYELFNADAKIAAQLLGLTLTQRQGMPMAGIPHHAVNSYLRRLIDGGWKVAICDQLEPPRPGKLVKRALTRIYTPGTMIEDGQMEAGESYYLLAFTVRGDFVHAAWLEASTGELHIVSSKDREETLATLSALNPREILLSEGEMETWSDRREGWLEAFQLLSSRRLTTELPASHFDRTNGLATVLKTLAVASLDGFGVAETHPALGPAGALLYYASRNLGGQLRNVYKISEVLPGNILALDARTVANLEIFRSVRGTREGSLFQAIDRTRTAAGARLLGEYLARPLQNLDEIVRRQSCVGELVAHPAALKRLRELLGGVRDLLRMLGRLQNRLRLPREVGGILATLDRVPAIAETLLAIGPHLAALASGWNDFSELCHYLRRALADSLPQDTREGGFLRDGFHGHLDHLRQLLRSGTSWIAELEAAEQARTGIRNLRIRRNGTFGYYIEITKANLHAVPAHYVRRQSTVGGERYITEELRTKEREICEAQGHALALEQELFEEVAGRVIAEGGRIAAVAHALAEIDLFTGWAQLALEWNYVRPTVDAGKDIAIEGGRHPVVEQMEVHRGGGREPFVANDTHLTADGRQIILLTGPNMGGKSTHIRQVALIVLLAQCGCWVPATAAHIGRVDQIFSRIGAGDDLSRGQSTFLVEMWETAAILHRATASSLVILDEVGRGTSTYDGLSIAWAVLEHLHGQRVRTLFATHYQELTRLAGVLPRVYNCHVAVRERDDEILFLRKIVDGPADRSYGIHVAKLAGFPDTVIARARAILQSLEKERSALQVNLRSES
ncbi:MAG: DNA mismatch repair protein MutS [Puniceicoccales bacterium]|jgi:DNA mismatch repair protein MutS|nr:DNA mismatch repair protein MutS [Puniceicoccales bacterium]